MPWRLGPWLSKAEMSGVVLHLDFAPDLIEKRNNSSNLLLIGVSLSRTIETSFNALQSTLARGGTIRVVLTDPEASDAAIDARCQATRPGIDEIREEIRTSLRALGRLAAGRGDLQVRTTKSALKFGLNYVDVGKSSATLHVQLYSFRSDGESRPIIVLDSRDGEWSEYYAKQAEGIWDDSDEVTLVDRPLVQRWRRGQ